MTSDVLFEWIETQEKEERRPWGHVLDAGEVASLTAVTGEASLAKELRDKYGREHVSVLSGNWKDPTLLQDKTYDVVIADYLIGSVEGFAPYYQESMMSRLVQHLAPNGRLYLVGLEPISEVPATTDSHRVVKEMQRLRDACLLVAGTSVYREFPMSWCERQIRLESLEVSSSVRFANVYTPATIKRQLDVGRRHLHLVSDRRLASELEKALERVLKEAEAKFPRTEFGFDYVLCARHTS